MGDRGHNRHGPKRGGLLCPFDRELGPRLWPGPRSASVPSGVFIHPAVWPQWTLAKNWVGAVPFSMGPDRTQSRLGRSLLHTKWRLHPFSRLATIDMGQKLGGAVLFFWGSWVPIEHKVAWAEAYLHTKCHLHPSSRLATIDIGRKLGDSAAFLGRGNWVPVLHTVTWT